MRASPNAGGREPAAGPDAKARRAWDAGLRRLYRRSLSLLKASEDLVKASVAGNPDEVKARADSGPAVHR